jgi:hypothetical protein
MPFNVPPDQQPEHNKKVKGSLELLTADVTDQLRQIELESADSLVEAYNQPISEAELTQVPPSDMVTVDPQMARRMEIDSLRMPDGTIYRNANELFSQPLNADRAKAVGFVDNEGNATPRGELFFNLKESGVFNEDGTINEKGQAYLLTSREVEKPENRWAFKILFDDGLTRPDGTFDDALEGAKEFVGKVAVGAFDIYRMGQKLTSPTAWLDIVKDNVYGKQTIAEQATSSLATLEQSVKNVVTTAGYLDILQGLTGDLLYKGIDAANDIQLTKELSDAAEDNLYAARQRQYSAQQALQDVQVGEIAEAVFGIDNAAKAAQEFKQTLGEEKFNRTYSGSSAVTELFGNVENVIPASKAFTIAGSVPRASRAILKAQQTLGKVAQMDVALAKAGETIEAGNSILRKEAIQVPLAQKLASDISARAAGNPELLTRANQASEVSKRLTASADEVRSTMPTAMRELEELTAKRNSLATRIPEVYAQKVMQTAELGRRLRSAPARTMSSILERTGETLTKVDDAVTGYLKDRGLDQAYNAALGASGVVGLAGNPLVGAIGITGAALKTGKFLSEYGKILRYVGKEMENARGQIPFWKRVAAHTAPGSLGRGIAHTFNIFELGGATSDIIRRAGRGVAAAYPSDLFFEWLSDGGDMRPQTMTQAAAESLVIGGSFAAGGGAFMGTKKRMRELAVGDEINFRQGLTDTKQKALYEALPPGVRRSMATYSIANPTLNYNFIDSGTSGYDINTNTANININSNNPLKALVAHETLHHTLIKNNMEGGIAALFLGDTKTNAVGGLFRSKDGQLDPEFNQFKDGYYNRLRSAGMTDAEIGVEYPLDKIAVEYFIDQHADQYATMAETGELGALAARGEVRKKLGSVLETVLPKIPVLRDLHIKSGGMIDKDGEWVTGNGILGAEGIRQNPIANKMFREMSRRSSGMMPGQFEPLISDKEGSGAPLMFDPANAIDMELMHPFIQVDDNDKPILKDGRPVFIDKSVDIDRAMAGLTAMEAMRKRRESNYIPEKGEAYVDDDGDMQPGWLSDSVLNEMFAKHKFNNEQKRMIRQTNRLIKQGDGQRMVMINFPATTRLKSGKVVYAPQKAAIRDAVPVAMTISKDGNILYGLMSVTKLQENIKKRAQSKRGKQLYSSNIDLILLDTQAMMDFHKKGEDSINYFNEKYGAVEGDKRKKFINTMFGLLNQKEQAVLNPMLLEDGIKSKDNVYRTYRADRVSKAVPMAPEEYAAMPFSYEAVSQVRMPEAQRAMPEGEQTPTRFMPEGVDEDKFYSQLERVITDKVPTRATAQQIMATIDPTRGSGVKADEIKWSGIEQALTSLEKDGKVSKEDLINYLRNEGMVRFEEVVRNQPSGIAPEPQLPPNVQVEEINGDWYITNPIEDEGPFATEEEATARMMNPNAGYLTTETAIIGQNPLDQTRFSQYVLPGGENYREVVLAMPTGQGISRQEAIQLRDQAWSKIEQLPDFPTGTNPLYQVRWAEENHPELYAEWSDFSRAANNKSSEVNKGVYTSSHFPDIPNYVAHMRTNERTLDDGSEGLFVEEFQSDRHQAGRKKGYAGEDSGEIPDAPFRTTWPIQLFKRALRDAVDGGKDWIGWTTGETQNERFDLSKSLDSIEVRRIDGSNRVTVYGTKGNNNVITQQSTLEALPDVIGKELAEKVIFDMSPKGTPQQIQRAKIAAEEARKKLQQPGVGYDSPLFDEYERKAEEFRVLNGKSDVSYSGLDLKVGGEGMKGFYDNMLPKEVGKYVKQFGGKVEKAALETPKGKPTSYENFEAWKSSPSIQSTTIWKVNITPEMRKISQTGQMRFMPEDYRGTHTAPTSESAPAHDLTVNGVYPADVYTRPDWYEQDVGLDEMRKIQRLKGNPNASITIYRAVPFDVAEEAKKTGSPAKYVFRSGDWVTTSQKYAKDHGDSALNGKYRIFSKRVKAKDIYTNGDSIFEWGYNPATEEEKTKKSKTKGNASAIANAAKLK